MADEPQTPPPVKSGIATTEFWQSMAVTGVGLFLLVRGALSNPINETVMLIGAGMAGVTALGYAGARTLAKR